LFVLAALSLPPHHARVLDTFTAHSAALAGAPPTRFDQTPHSPAMSRLQQDHFVDDEEEECCPLCVEEFDLSDRNFRPCPCGYQVCYTARVWWSHLESPY
jgi:hypothetical protein